METATLAQVWGVLDNKNGTWTLKIPFCTNKNLDVFVPNGNNGIYYKLNYSSYLYRILGASSNPGTIRNSSSESEKQYKSQKLSGKQYKCNTTTPEW
eukprot:201448-Rhodomonas_salina.2